MCEPEVLGARSSLEIPGVLKLWEEFDRMLMLIDRAGRACHLQRTSRPEAWAPCEAGWYAARSWQCSHRPTQLRGFCQPPVAGVNSLCESTVTLFNFFFS